jgi:opacity protein-like surface antigen
VTVSSKLTRKADRFVRAGVNVSGIENSEAKMKLGLRVGAGVDYAINGLFSVQPMIYYSSKGISEGGNNLGVNSKESLKLDYLELPVLGSFHFKLSNKCSLAAKAGPYVGYLLNQSPSGTTTKYEKFDFGINAGLDVNINKFVIGAEAQYGFADVSSNIDKLHNINYALMVGYRF